MWACCGRSPGVFGLVASDPTVSRLIATLAEDPDGALGAITGARAVARERVWNRAGAPTQDGQVVIDLDATLLTAHSDKEDATSTWKKGFGHHRLLGFADHGAGGGGEPVAELLRPGKAGSNTAVDHVAVFDAALAQIPQKLRTPDETGRVAVGVRTDAAGATREFAAHLAQTGVGFCLGANLGHFDVHTARDSEGNPVGRISRSSFVRWRMARVWSSPAIATLSVQTGPKRT